MGLVIGALIVVAILIAIVLLYGVRLSSLIYKDSLSTHHTPPKFDITASSNGNGSITLRAAHRTARLSDWQRCGTYGIASAGGHGCVGEVIEVGADYVIRQYSPLTATIGAAEAARIDLNPYPNDPKRAHNITYKNVRYKSDLGEFQAWHTAGSANTWVIFVHGRGASPDESLRILPTLTELGFPVLAITYRNDRGVPSNPDNRHWFGLTEWRDLEAAAQYALDNGAEDIVLFAYSMGGGICINFLYESALADRVSGVVLDSPMLDFEATLDYAARLLGYPSFIIRYGKAFAALRYGIDWKRMNYLTHASSLSTPMLLLHGEADSIVPAETSRSLMYARPDIVRYVGFDGTEHAAAWNHDRSRYEMAVRDFLCDVRPERISPPALP